jgi:hypothetical protein
VLVDCGFFQGSRKIENYNRLPRKGAIDRLHAVVVTHAHLDHTGRLPLLTKAEYAGPIYGTAPTFDLADLILRDWAYLHGADVERENRRRAERDQPLLEVLFTDKDVPRLRPLYKRIRYDHPTEVAPGVVVRLVDAGHILGSAGVEMTIEEDGQRFRAVLDHVDAIRLDHFRAFAAAWHIPADAPTAKSGKWMPGPGAEFFHAVRRELKALPFIVEDLGLITPDVIALRDQFNLPGNRILQFAFEGDRDNPHLPENHVFNTVASTATHDNPTTRGWFEDLSDARQRNVWRYLKRPAGASEEAAWKLIRLVWRSKAALAIAPLQDLLKLGPEGRMNKPGSAEGNWRWRCTQEMMGAAAWDRLRELTEISDRLPDRRAMPCIAEATR